MALPISEISSLYNDANLKYYWKFDGNSTGTIGGQNGTETTISYSSTIAKFTQALALASSDSKVTFGTVFAPRATAGTISVWIYLTGNGTDGGPIYSFSSYYAKGWLYYRIGVLDTNKIKVCYYSSGATHVAFTSDTALTLNTWHLVTYTWNSTGSTIYIDGEEDATSALTFYDGHSGGDTELVCVGTKYPDDASWLSGYLDDLAFFDRELSAEEVLLLYEGTANVSHYEPMSFIV